jgi:hypothetical protein
MLRSYETTLPASTGFFLTLPLVEVPSPSTGSQTLNPALPDLRGKHRAEPVPPKPNRFMADFDAAFVQQILNIAERQREPNVQHHRQADDFRAALKALERVRFGHVQTLRGRPARLNLNLSDKTPPPVRIRSHTADPVSADLSREHRAKSIPPEPNRFMTNLNATLMQQVFNVAKRQRKSNVHHYRQANDLRAGFEVAKWAGFSHPTRLAARLKPVLSDSAPD